MCLVTARARRPGPSPVASAPRPARRWPLAATPIPRWGNNLRGLGTRIEAQGLGPSSGVIAGRNCISYFGSAAVAPSARLTACLIATKLQGPRAERCEQGPICAGTAASPITISSATTRRVLLKATAQAKQLRATAGDRRQRAISPVCSWQRPIGDPYAYQAAYAVLAGSVRRPVDPIKFVDGLSQPTTSQPKRGRTTAHLLYAMDLGDGVHSLGKNSLAWRPAVSPDVLQRRLQAAAWRSGGVAIEANPTTKYICCSPMNLSLPDLSQRWWFSGVGRMVHPASGYPVGAAACAALLGWSAAKSLRRSSDPQTSRGGGGSQRDWSAVGRPAPWFVSTPFINLGWRS